MTNPVQNIPNVTMNDPNTNARMPQQHQEFIPSHSNNSSYSQQYYVNTAQQQQHSVYTQQQRQFQRQQAHHHLQYAPHGDNTAHVQAYQHDIVNPPFQHADYNNFPQFEGHHQMYQMHDADDRFTQQNIQQRQYIPVQRDIQYSHDTQQYQPQIHQIFHEEVVQTTPHENVISMSNPNPQPYSQQMTPTYYQHQQRQESNPARTPYREPRQQETNEMSNTESTQNDDYINILQDQQCQSYIVPQAEMFQQTTMEQQYLPSVGSTCTVETSASPIPPTDQNNARDVYDFSLGNDDNEMKIPTKAPSAFATGMSMPAVYQPTSTSSFNKVENKSDVKQSKRNFSTTVPALEEEDEEDELSPNRTVISNQKVVKAKPTPSKLPTDVEEEQLAAPARKRSRKQELPSTKKTAQVVSSAANSTVKSSNPGVKLAANPSKTSQSKILSTKSGSAKVPMSNTTSQTPNTKCTSPTTKNSNEALKSTQVTTATKNTVTNTKIGKLSASVSTTPKPNPKKITKISTAPKKESKDSTKEDTAHTVSSSMAPTSGRRPVQQTQKSKEKEKETASANTSILGNILAASTVPPKIQTSKRSVMLSDSFMDALSDQGPKKAKIVRKKVVKKDTQSGDSTEQKGSDTAPTKTPLTNAQRMAAAAPAATAMSGGPPDIVAENEARRRIHFADERGGQLVEVRFFEVEEGERTNVSKISPEEMKHQEIQNERLQGERRGLHFKPTHLPMPQGFQFRQSGNSTSFRPWKLIPVDGIVELVERGCNSESKLIELKRQNTVMEAFNDPFITLQMEDIDEENNRRTEPVPPPKVIPLEASFSQESLESSPPPQVSTIVSSPLAISTAPPSVATQLPPLPFSEGSPLSKLSPELSSSRGASSFAEAISGAANLSRLSAILPPNVAALVSGTSAFPTSVSQPVTGTSPTTGSSTFSSPADALPFEKKLLAEAQKKAAELESPASPPVALENVTIESDSEDGMDTNEFKSPEGPASPDNTSKSAENSEMADDDMEDTDIRYIPIERPAEADKIDTDNNASNAQNAISDFSDINAFMNKLRSSGIIDGANWAPGILNKVKSSISNAPVQQPQQQQAEPSQGSKETTALNTSTTTSDEWSNASAIASGFNASHSPVTTSAMNPSIPGFGASIIHRGPHPGFHRPPPPNQPCFRGSPRFAGRFPSNYGSPRYGSPRPPLGGYGFYGASQQMPPMTFFPRPTTTSTLPSSSISQSTAPSTTNAAANEVKSSTTNTNSPSFSGANTLNNKTNNVVSGEINSVPSISSSVSGAQHIQSFTESNFATTSKNLRESVPEPDVKPPGLGGSPPAQQHQSFLGDNDSLENVDVEALMPVAKTFVKQCTYYMADGCSFGDMCHFAHGNIMTAGLRHAIAAVNAGHRPFTSAAGYRGFHNRGVANVSAVGGGIELNYDERSKKLRTIQIPPSHVMVSGVGNEPSNGSGFSRFPGGGRGGKRFMSPVRRGGIEPRRFGGRRGRRSRSRSISPVRTSSKRRSRSRSPHSSSRRHRSRYDKDSKKSNDPRNRNRSASNSSSASKSSGGHTPNEQESVDKDKRNKNRDRSPPSRHHQSRSPSPSNSDRHRRRSGHRDRRRSRSNTYSDMDDHSNRRRNRGDNRQHEKDAKKLSADDSKRNEEASFGHWMNSLAETNKVQHPSGEPSAPADEGNQSSSRSCSASLQRGTGGDESDDCEMNAEN